MKPVFKKSVCIICKKEYEERRLKQQTCSPKCAVIHADNYIEMSKTKTATQKRIDFLNRFCDANNVEVDEFYTKSYRLTKENQVTLDYYPKSQKCFFHDCKEWGDVTNLNNFLPFQFT